MNLSVEIEQKYMIHDNNVKIKDVTEQRRNKIELHVIEIDRNSCNIE